MMLVLILRFGEKNELVSLLSEAKQMLIPHFNSSTYLVSHPPPPLKIFRQKQLIRIMIISYLSDSVFHRKLTTEAVRNVSQGNSP